MINYIPNTITILRIAGSLTLLLFKPFTASFFFLYVLCGISDMLDGFIARITNTVSAKGAILDSMADTVFFGIVLVLFIPILPIKLWMILWILGIFVIRILSWIIGFIKYRTFASLHTYANKAAGFVLFCFPILWKLFGLSITIIIICTIAGISALEEFTITIISKELSPNTSSLHNQLSRRCRLK